MFGAGIVGTEDEYTYFSDNQTNGFTHFVEWSTPSPIELKQIRLFAAGDGSFFNNEREFDRFNLLAKTGTNYETVLTFTPTHPYSFVDASNQLMLDTNFAAVTASDFRAEFMQYDGHRGFDGPRVIELDGFGTVLPSTNDLFDISQGIQILTNSPIRPSSDAANMLGASIGDSSENIYTYFSDDMPTGTVHSIEWQTMSPVLLKSIRLFAAGDGVVYQNQREFDHFTLKSRAIDSSNFIEIVSFKPEHPYAFFDVNSALLLVTNVGAITGQVFRAEFEQYTSSGPYNGPRIIELDGLGDILPAPAPQITLSPLGCEFTNSILVTITSSLTNATIRYTLDGSTPTTNSLVYDQAITLTNSATIVASMFVDGTPVFEPATASFMRVYVLDNQIPSSWLTKYFGESYRYDWRAASTADPDIDGATNEQEYLAGTDPLQPASQQPLEHLWDINSGIRITAHSPTRFKSSIANMFGSGIIGTEDEYTFFSDYQTNGFTHFVEWSTPSPIELKQIRLFAAGDGLPYNNQREFDHFTLLAKIGTNYETVLTFTPTHPYSFVDASNLLVLDTYFPAVTASDFRAEFVQYNGYRGYDGPRIIELDGMGKALIETNNNQTRLLNVNFYADKTPTMGTNKVGMAATGISTNDIWNAYSRDDENANWKTIGSLTNMAFADGTASGIDMTVIGASGAWPDSHPDTMYRTYLYGSESCQIVLTNIFQTNIDVYFYSHGANDDQNAKITLSSGTVLYGPKATTTTPAWRTDAWEEGTQYVLFKNVQVVSNAIAITASPDASGLAPINGMQILLHDPNPISEAWLIKYFGANYAIDQRSAAAADPDQDGVNNLAEWKAGTNPLDAQSFFKLSLVNIDYAAHLTPYMDSHKKGLGAIGQSATDVWNIYSRDEAEMVWKENGSVQNLLWADGTTSQVGMTISNAPGAWPSEHPDEMFSGYLYSLNNGPVLITITNLSSGSFDFFLYGHGAADNQNSKFSLYVGTECLGSLATSTTSGWTNINWVEGDQYVAFRGIQVVNGQTVTIKVENASSFHGYVNGLQIVSSFGDTIPVSWRTRYFGQNYYANLSALDSADPDQDGASNSQEFQSGTNPLDPSSVVDPNNIIKATVRLVPAVFWNSQSNVLYRVLRQDGLNSTNLVTIGNNIPGNGDVTVFTDYSATNSLGFYIIEKQP